MKKFLPFLILFISIPSWGQYKAIFITGHPEIRYHHNKESITLYKQILPGSKIELRVNDLILLVNTANEFLYLTKPGTYNLKKMKFKKETIIPGYDIPLVLRHLEQNFSNIPSTKDIESLKTESLKKRYSHYGCGGHVGLQLNYETNKNKRGETILLPQPIFYTIQQPCVTKLEIRVKTLFDEVIYSADITNKASHQINFLNLPKAEDGQPYLIETKSTFSGIRKEESTHEAIWTNFIDSSMTPNSFPEYFLLAAYFDLNRSPTQAFQCFNKTYELNQCQESANYFGQFLKSLTSSDKYKSTKAVTRKPVIYLYPEKEDTIDVKINYDGKLTYTYPEYNKGWSIIAKPDGNLFNLQDSSEHNYLFYEGEKHLNAQFYFSSGKGFCVKGVNTINFLKKQLAQLGLTPKEYNDFIVYWMPFMQDNPYNQIYFWVDEEYNKEVSTLDLSTQPNSERKVFMIFRKLENPISLTPQVFPEFRRTGFALVEWGGAEIK